MLIWSDSRNCSTEFEQKNQSTQHERGDYTVSLAQQNYQLTDRNVHFQTAQHILVHLRERPESRTKDKQRIKKFQSQVGYEPMTPWLRGMLTHYCYPLTTAQPTNKAIVNLTKLSNRLRTI